MSTTYEIPLLNTPQTLTVSLGGTVYTLNVLWNNESQTWTVDFLDSSGNLLLAAVPLVTGVDLLEQYPDLNFGGQLIAFTDYNPDQPPSFQDLGATGHLQFVVG